MAVVIADLVDIGINCFNWRNSRVNLVIPLGQLL